MLPDGGPGLLGGPSLGGGLGGRPVLLRGAGGKQISAKNDTKSCGESGGIGGGVMHTCTLHLMYTTLHLM